MTHYDVCDPRPMETPDPTLTDMVRAVIDNPGCDTTRLVCADAFEEAGNPERAEFIRVQVAIAAIPPGVEDDSLPSLRDRECNLFEQFWGKFREHAQKWSNLVGLTEWLLPQHIHAHGLSTAFYFRRGFVSSVHLPLRSFLQSASLLTAKFPLTAIHLTDKRPEHIQGTEHDWILPGDFTYMVGEALSEASSIHLPSCIWEHMEKSWFSTEQEARNVLSRACLSHAKRMASK